MRLDLHAAPDDGAGTVFAICFLILLLFWGIIGSVAVVGALTVSEATITIEERVGAHGEEGIFLIITAEGEQFTVEDNLFRLQFDASNRYAALKEGGRYHVTCTGWRYPLFSWYRNIVAATPVQEDVTP